MEHAELAKTMSAAFRFNKFKTKY